MPPFIVHPQYQFREAREGAHVFYDFTLLELSSPVDFTEYPHIRPVCLPGVGNTSEGGIVTVAGWGNTEVEPVTLGDIVKGLDIPSLSDTLQKIDLG